MRFLCLKIFGPMSKQRLRGITLIDYKKPFLEQERVNDIAIQARHFGANLPPALEIEQARTRKRLLNGHGFRNMKTDHKIHQWRKFLSNSKDKSLLIKSIAEEWQNERHRERLAGKAIFVTTEDHCYEVFSIGMTTRGELRSTQGESVSPLTTCSSRRIQSCSYYLR